MMTIGKNGISWAASGMLGMTKRREVYEKSRGCA